MSLSEIYGGCHEITINDGGRLNPQTRLNKMYCKSTIRDKKLTNFDKTNRIF